MNNDQRGMEIDLVYLWVDGSDPVWQARKAATLGVGDADEEVRTSETSTKARHVSNNELRYSLRSAAKFAPWIRRIFIVTDGQTPAWLDTSNPRVRLVDQKDILPPEALPCYNSAVIEYFLYRIPGLAEHFLYANDDMMFGAPLQPDFFFTPDGRPIVRLKRKYLGKLRLAVKRLTGIGFGYYRRSIVRAAELVERETGCYFSGIPHHNIDAYTKTDHRIAVEEVFKEEIAASLSHHTRTEGDLQRVIFSFYALATGRASLVYVDNRTSLRIGVQKRDYAKVFDRWKPSLFCLNDNQRASDDDRRRIRPFLSSLLAEPSEFEKQTRPD